MQSETVHWSFILGFTNLIADSFTMSAGPYLSKKNDPENFDDAILEEMVETITADKDCWIDVMIKEELLMSGDHKSPWAMGRVTFISFLLFDFGPLIV